MKKINNNYEFIKNQIFDFISFNPPKYGVNWLSTMEVSIRGANLCMITDILLSENKLMKNEKLIILNNKTVESQKIQK